MSSIYIKAVPKDGEPIEDALDSAQTLANSTSTTVLLDFYGVRVPIEPGQPQSVSIQLYKSLLLKSRGIV